MRYSVMPYRKQFITGFFLLYATFSGHAQHHAGLSISGGTGSAVNTINKKFPYGFENGLGIFYRIEPKTTRLGLYMGMEWHSSKYQFRFNPNDYHKNSAMILQQNMLMFIADLVFPLKKNNVLLLFGFNAGTVIHSQTELRSETPGGTFYYSDYILNSLQKPNLLQADINAGIEKMIGEKKRLSAGSMLQLNVTSCLRSDFVYAYTNAQNHSNELRINKNFYPVTLAAFLRFAIITKQ